MFCCGKCWCVYCDPIGYLAFVIGLLQVLFVDVCTIGVVIYPTFGFSSQGILLTSLILFFTIMVLWCGFKASFTEPGIVSESRKVSEEEKQFYIEERWNNYCQVCDQLKPFRAHHCRKCGVCVLKMDHHCPWINNCVGARNQKYFILYLIYVHMGEMLASILGGWRIWTMRGYIQYYTELVHLRYFYPINQYLPNWMLDHLFLPVFDPHVYAFVFLAIEVFFSLIFALFVIVLLYDQIRSIRYDLTYVEFLKQYRINTGENTFYDCLISTMGEPPCWRWFFPIEGRYMNAIIQKLSSEFITVDMNNDDDDEDEIEDKKEK